MSGMNTKWVAGFVVSAIAVAGSIGDIRRVRLERVGVGPRCPFLEAS